MSADLRDPPAAAGAPDTARFCEVTEIDGQMVSREQVERACQRYRWAADRVRGQSVVEVGCGAGQGLGMLAEAAAELYAGDRSPEVLSTAIAHFNDAATLSVFDAEALPFPDGRFDAVLLFEAIYYINAPRFFAEAHRVLRAGGQLLVVTANRDLFDFNPSPYSTVYLGVPELDRAMSAAGFGRVEFGGGWDTAQTGIRQRLFRPLKYAASRLGLMPRTMRGKGLLKRLVFGRMTAMPADLRRFDTGYTAPEAILMDRPDRRHKVIFAAAYKD